jgi:uncharacterized protein (DUF58 family)
MNAPLLNTPLLRQLEQFELVARRRARSAARGERRSRARGQSVEFADHRSYVSGDDLRHLDWNLYGRLDRLFVKLYEEERELPVLVLLDASESMTFGAPAKFDFARRLAAALGYVALCGFDRVTVRVFPETADAAEATHRGGLRAVRGRRAAPEFFLHLAALTAGGAADFNAALRRGALETRQAGAAVVLSDFLDPAGYAPGLDALAARGFQVSAVQVLAPEELHPATFGDLRMVDSETGAEQEVTFGRHRLKAYRQAVETYTQKLREHCQARGVRFFRAASDTALETLLLKELREGRVLG